MQSNLKYLSFDLPEDISKLKGAGQFKKAHSVIDKRLASNIPQALKNRLMLEKEILDIIPAWYPYTFDTALAHLQNNLNDFTKEELNELWELDAVDWYYIEGEVHFKDDILENLVKVRPAYTARAKDKSTIKDKEGNFSQLNTAIQKMKSKGNLAYKIRIKATLKVNENAWQEGKTLQVHLPIPIEYAQVKNLKILNISPTPTLINEPTYPQRTVYFEGVFDKDQVFTVEYEFENHSIYRDLKPEKVLAAQPTFYTEEHAPHVVFTPYIKKLTEEIVGDEKNPLLKARKIYDFITQKIMYSFVRPYNSYANIPMFAATSLKGDCGVQAILFITMCRCAGVPSTWQSGLYVNPLSIGNHDWAQFYVAPYGWLFADCSFGGSAWREKALERHDFYFGHLEPFRMPSTSEFLHDFNPPFNYLRHDTTDNQVGEAHYVDYRLKTTDYETTKEMISVEEI